MRVIVETQSRLRRRRHLRLRRALRRWVRPLAGMPHVASEGVTFQRVSRVRTAVGAVVPRVLVDNLQVRAMAIDLAFGTFNVAYALINVVAGLLTRSVWTLSVGVVIAALNMGKSYLASGALMSVARYRKGESADSLRRCQRAGLAMVLMTLAMSGTIIQLVLQGTGRAYPGMLLYLYAAHALFTITNALVNAVRARRVETLAVRGVRCFNLAGALISIFALQNVALSRVAWEALPVAVPRGAVEGSLGGVVCLAMIAMGTWLAFTARVRLVARWRRLRVFR